MLSAAKKIKVWCYYHVVTCACAKTAHFMISWSNARFAEGTLHTELVYIIEEGDAIRAPFVDDLMSDLAMSDPYHL